MTNSQANVSYQQWGEHAGCQVYLFKLQNASGAYVELTNYGATLVAAVVPDKAGNLENVVLGYPSLAGYLADEYYLGATIGRFANRIGGAKFILDGVTYQLDNNDGNNINHGGDAGFNSQIFDYAITESAVSFSLLSEDGDGGFPGNLKLSVTYSWSEDNELKITYHAVSDKKTIANFTNHAYFNLSAKGIKIFDHTLKIYADSMLEIDEAYIPTGLIKAAGKRALNGEVLMDKMIIDDVKINGYNDCFILQNNAEKELNMAALLADNSSGRRMQVLTSYPSIIVYTGDYLGGKPNSDHLYAYHSFEGVCLECQYYPDCPNHSNFPCTVLNPADVYHETIIYKFFIAY